MKKPPHREPGRVDDPLQQAVQRAHADVPGAAELARLERAVLSALQGGDGNGDGGDGRSSGGSGNRPQPAGAPHDATRATAASGAGPLGTGLLVTSLGLGGAALVAVALVVGSRLHWGRRPEARRPVPEASMAVTGPKRNGTMRLEERELDGGAAQTEVGRLAQGDLARSGEERSRQRGATGRRIAASKRRDRGVTRTGRDVAAFAARSGAREPVRCAPYREGDPASLALREARALEEARQALAAARPTVALRRLDELRRCVPGGVLSEEREALRIEALWTMGHRSQARRALQGFARRFPRSAHVARLRSRFEGVGAGR